MSKPGTAVQIVAGGCALGLLFTLLVHRSASADTVDLYRTVAAYFYAVGENRVMEAMSHYHPDSPQAAEVRRELVFGRSAYLQRTNILSFDLVHHDSRRAVALATHRHLRVAGIKFMEELAASRYVFIRQGGVWKIWSRTDQPCETDCENRGDCYAPNSLC